jgi:hypothetical protein
MASVLQGTIPKILRDRRGTLQVTARRGGGPAEGALIAVCRSGSNVLLVSGMTDSLGVASLRSPVGAVDVKAVSQAGCAGANDEETVYVRAATTIPITLDAP